MSLGQGNNIIAGSSKFEGDNLTITKNISNKSQVAAVIDNNSGIVKEWTGTAAEYEALANKDNNTLYHITDDISGDPIVLGQILETVNNKQDVLQGVGDYVVEKLEPTAANNYTWYRKYKSGWVEQGGYVVKTNATSYVQNLPITMFDNNYTCVISPSGSDSDTGGWSNLEAALCGEKTEYNQGKNETHFRVSCTETVGFEWQVSGIAA